MQCETRVKNAGADPLEKREQFAVSLRKGKRQEIIRQKRRKIMTAATNGECDEKNAPFRGYGPWRLQKYEPMIAML